MNRYIILLFCMLAMAACGTKQANEQEHNHDLGHDHEHEHEDEPRQYTNYSSKYELYIEALPFIKGETTRILAHITSLENFKPLREGIVSARLVVGEKQTQQTLEKPQRAGIYHFSLQAQSAGSAKLIFDIQSKTGNDQIEIRPISVYEDTHAVLHAPHSEPFSDGIVFTKEQSWKLDFETQEAKPSALNKVLHTSGVLQTTPQSELLINASSTGLISMPGNLIEGNKVKKGTILFNISGNKLVDNNSTVRFIEAQNAYQEAKTHVKRIEALAKDQIVSQQELLEAQLKYKHAEAVLTNLKQNFNPRGETIVSPTTAYVSERYVDNGAFVNAGSPLAKLSNTHRLLLKADLHPEDAAQLSTIADVRIKANTHHRILSIHDLNGNLLNIGNQVNPNNYMRSITFEMDNPEEFTVGQIVEIWIHSQSDRKGFKVPNTALIEEQGSYYIMVQLSPELFEKRLIVKGISDGVYTEIVSGLSLNERYVSKGANMLKLAQASGTLDPHAGHVH